MTLGARVCRFKMGVPAARAGYCNTRLDPGLLRLDPGLLCLSPKVERGFHAACEDLSPARKLVVYPGNESFPLGNDVHPVPLHALCRELATKAL